MNDRMTAAMPRSILNRSEAPGMSPAKWGTVVGLGSLFAIVVVIQWFRMSGDPNVPVKSEPTESTVVSVTRATSAVGNGTGGTNVEVPMVPVGRDSHPEANAPIEAHAHRVSIERVVRIDPFARIETIESNDVPNREDASAGDMKSVEESTARIPHADSSRALTVDQIVIGPNGAAVRIGETWYGVGQRWEHYRIEAIRRDGLVLSAE